MDWQSWLVVLAVVLAAAYLGRGAWRTWRGRSGGCGGGCKCSGAAPKRTGEGAPSDTLIPVEQLTLRPRPKS